MSSGVLWAHLYAYKAHMQTVEAFKTLLFVYSWQIFLC